MCGVVEAHFAVVCQKRKEVSDVVVMHESDSDGLFIDSISDKKSNKDNCWIERLLVEGCTVEFKLDTGSQVNILPQKIFESIKHQLSLKAYPVKLEAYGGFRLKVAGATECRVTHQGIQYNLKFVIVEDVCQPLLGIESCVELGLVRRVDSLDLVNLDLFKKQNKDVFEGLDFFQTHFV